MKKLLIILTFLPFAVNAQKIEMRGFVGLQTITTVKAKEQFHHSVYALFLVSYKRFNFNVQPIQPIFPFSRWQFKAGADVCIFQPKKKLP